MAKTYYPPSMALRPSFRPTTSQPAYITTQSRRAAKVDLGATARRRTTRPERGRPAMRTTAPFPREVDFERIRALDIFKNGPRIRISDKSVMDVLTIRVPDPNDKNFLAEQRPQRTMSVAQSLGDLAMEQVKTGADLQRRLATLHAWLDTGRDPSGAENATVGALVSQVLGAVSPTDLRPVDRLAVYTALRGLDIPISQAAGEVGKRYLTLAEYKDHFPELATYLTARALALGANPMLRPPTARSKYNPDKPITGQVRERKRVHLYDFSLLDLLDYWKQPSHAGRLLDVRDLEWVDTAGASDAEIAAMTSGRFGVRAEEEKKEEFDPLEEVYA